MLILGFFAESLQIGIPKAWPYLVILRLEAFELLWFEIAELFNQVLEANITLQPGLERGENFVGRAGSRRYARCAWEQGQQEENEAAHTSDGKRGPQNSEQLNFLAEGLSASALSGRGPCKQGPLVRRVGVVGLPSPAE